MVVAVWRWCRGGGCGSRSRRRPGCCSRCSCWSRCWTWRSTPSSTGDFDPVGDWSYLGPGIGVLGDSIGAGWARVVAVLAGLATLAVLVGVPLAMLRLVRVAAGRRRLSLTAATAFVTAWVLCFATGVQAVEGAPVASASAATLTVDEVQLVRGRPRRPPASSPARSSTDAVRRAAARTRRPCSPGSRGKDVLLVFVESYGRVAVQDTSLLRWGHAGPRPRAPSSCAAAGYQRAERVPHLAHVRRRAAGWPTPRLQSGLWVDSERRYRQLLGADRMTLTSLFGRGGLAHRLRRPRQHRGLAGGQGLLRLRRLLRLPQRRLRRARSSATRRCPTSTRSRDFRRRELAPADRPPVMAEIDLISSHHPWTPLPAHGPVGPGRRRVGLRRHAGAGGAPPRRSSATPRRSSGSTASPIEYSWQALTSFLDDLRRPEPRAGRPRRPPAAHLRQRRGRRPRRADQRDRPGPGGHGADRRLGLAGRPASRPRTPRSGGWTPSATASSRRSAPLNLVLACPSAGLSLACLVPRGAVPDRVSRVHGRAAPRLAARHLRLSFDCAACARSGGRRMLNASGLRHAVRLVAWHHEGRPAVARGRDIGRADGCGSRPSAFAAQAVASWTGDPNRLDRRHAPRSCDVSAGRPLQRKRWLESTGSRLSSRTGSRRRCGPRPW